MTKSKFKFMCLVCKETGEFYPNQKWCICGGRLVRVDRCLVCKQDRANIETALCSYCSEILKYLVPLLAHRRESYGSYAPVEQDDLSGLHSLIYAIIEAKWDTDPDGDFPVEVQIINRTKYESPGYNLLPYAHKAGNIDQALDIVRKAVGNANSANDTLRRVFSHFELVVQDMKDEDC